MVNTVHSFKDADERADFITNENIFMIISETFSKTVIFGIFSDTTIKMRFLVCDLHQQIVQLHLEQFTGHHHSDFFIVYGSQVLSLNDFDQLTATQDGLMSLNSFLSTSLK
jgi:hypothetical protein